MTKKAWKKLLVSPENKVGLPLAYQKLIHFVWPNSFLDRCDFCRLPITFANSLDPDQDRQNVGPGLDPNHFDTDVSGKS